MIWFLKTGKSVLISWGSSPAELSSGLNLTLLSRLLRGRKRWGCRVCFFLQQNDGVDDIPTCISDPHFASTPEIFSVGIKRSIYSLSGDLSSKSQRWGKKYGASKKKQRSGKQSIRATTAVEYKIQSSTVLMYKFVFLPVHFGSNFWPLYLDLHQNSMGLPTTHLRKRVRVKHYLPFIYLLNPISSNYTTLYVSWSGLQSMVDRTSTDLCDWVHNAQLSGIQLVHAELVANILWVVFCNGQARSSKCQKKCSTFN